MKLKGLTCYNDLT